MSNIALMSETMAVRLGIPLIPFKDGKPEPMPHPVANILVGGTIPDHLEVTWHYWPLDAVLAKETQ